MDPTASLSHGPGLSVFHDETTLSSTLPMPCFLTLVLCAYYIHHVFDKTKQEKQWSTTNRRILPVATKKNLTISWQEWQWAMVDLLVNQNTNEA